MAYLLAGVTLLKSQAYWTFVLFFFYLDDILTKIVCIKKCLNRGILEKHGIGIGRTQTLWNTHFGNLGMTLRIYF